MRGEKTVTHTQVIDRIKNQAISDEQLFDFIISHPIKAIVDLKAETLEMIDALATHRPNVHRDLMNYQFTRKISQL